MKKIDFKKNVRLIHLWIGLLTGLIVFIVCITGCIYAFQKEIRLAAYPYYTVVHKNQQELTLDNLLNEYKRQSDNNVLRIYDFTETTRSTILLTEKDQQYFFSFLNPYTGNLLKEKNLASDFFVIVLYIHQNLLLGELGTQIIGWSVVVFILSLITGLILWFPKNTKVFKSKKGRKSKFSIKTKAKKHKVIFDLHNVLGFYASAILLVVAITGIAWTFTWVDGALYSLVTFEKKKTEKTTTITSTVFNKTALTTTKQQLDYNQNNRNLFIYYLPQQDTIPLQVTAYPNDDSFGSSDNYYLQPDSGRLIKSKLDSQKNAGEKFNSLYYDIHTGSILGIGGKIIVFLAGLIGASLPVTGTMLWIHNRKKKRAKTLTQKNNQELNNNTIPMRTKISILWFFIAIGWIVHHIYGLFSVYYHESVMMEGATGEVPFVHHMYRILFEGMALLFALLTLEVSKKWFVWISFIWAIIGGLYNLYHVLSSFMYEASNISEILVLILMVIASVFLIKNLNEQRING